VIKDAGLTTIAVKALYEEKFDHKWCSRIRTYLIYSIYPATCEEKIIGHCDPEY
jgi:hypothetical protein